MMRRHWLRASVVWDGLILLGLTIAGASPAVALSPELARKCRDLALKTYPYQLPGTGPGNAQNEIRYYKDCLAKDGKVTPPADRPSAPR